LHEHHSFPYPPLIDLENHLPRLKNSSNLLGAICTSKPEQQTLSAFHTPHEHNSSHKRTEHTRGLGQLKNFNKRCQLIVTSTRTFYEASVAEEEDRRRRRGHGDSTEDDAVDVCSGPFRRRARGRPVCCSTGFLRREIKRDPQSTRSWRWRTRQADGDI
jgi:hypothetical protein